MQQVKALEADLTRQLASRGLARTSGGFAFIHQGTVVDVSVDESVYRGLFVTVHGAATARQFRARDDAYDWDAIAVAIKQVAAPQRASLTQTHRAVDPALDTAISMLPSRASPGRVRVNLPELELDHVSALQLYALIQHALPALRAGNAKSEPALS